MKLAAPSLLTAFTVVLAACGGSTDAAPALASRTTVAHVSTSAPAPAVAPRPVSPLARLYWGAYVGGASYGRPDAPWALSSADLFQSHAGKKMTLLEWGEDWSDSSSGASTTTTGLQPFPVDLMNTVRSAGYLAVINWGTYQGGGPSRQPSFSLAKIASGTYDDYVRTWASAAAQWGQPFFLRLDWEMNLPSAPYSETANGNHAGDFVAAWRHLHDIFASAGATNVTWVWCPHVATPSSLPLQGLYPGDAYVDWVGLDGYNWGSTPNIGEDGGWRSFDEVFGASYAELTRLAPTKPIMIGEMGSTERGGSKAAWISEALAAIPGRYPSVAAVVWFNKNADHMDWVIESSPAAQAAFAEAVASPSYASALASGQAADGQ